MHCSITTPLARPLHSMVSQQLHTNSLTNVTKYGIPNQWTILSNQNFVGKIVCLHAQTVCSWSLHGQNCMLYLQTAFPWSKLLLYMGKLSLYLQTCFHRQSLYLHQQTRYSWSNSTFAFALLPCPSKRHVLVLATCTSSACSLKLI